jgi:hypothetical protein
VSCRHCIVRLDLVLQNKSCYEYQHRWLCLEHLCLSA